MRATNKKRKKKKQLADVNKWRAADKHINPRNNENQPNPNGPSNSDHDHVCICAVAAGESATYVDSAKQQRDDPSASAEFQ